MIHLFEILEKIKNHYGVYIGYKSIEKLADFISGFECAVYELTGTHEEFSSKFQIFIENKTKEISVGKHWSDIIAESESQESAFDLFFVYLDKFKQLTAVFNAFDVTYEENMKALRVWIDKK